MNQLPASDRCATAMLKLKAIKTTRTDLRMRIFVMTVTDLFREAICRKKVEETNIIHARDCYVQGPGLRYLYPIRPGRQTFVSAVETRFVVIIIARQFFKFKMPKNNSDVEI